MRPNFDYSCEQRFYATATIVASKIILENLNISLKNKIKPNEALIQFSCSYGYENNMPTVIERDKIIIHTNP